MDAKEFCDGLQRGGFWEETCKMCGKRFDAVNEEEVCKSCQKYYNVDKYGDERNK